VWEEKAESPELRIRIYTARRKWKILQAQGDPPYCRWAPCRSTPPTARPSQSPERKKNESCIICRDASVHFFFLHVASERERKCFNQLGGSFNFFFILACPEKGNYILAGLMCGHDTIYTLKCSLTAPRQPIISLFFSGRDESLSDAGNLVNFVVKRCTKSNGFGVSLLTKTE
jgi:hypothetical protein